MPRSANRLRALAGALTGALARPRLAARPANPRRILVLHELLLGDTVMLAPLLAALRSRYADADIFVTSSPAYAGLFSEKPYGVRVLPYSEREPGALDALGPAADCDIAFLPGDNRHAMTARAIGARWIVGFTGGKTVWRNRAVDELVEFPSEPAALADLFATLAGLDGPSLRALRYRKGDWPAPAFEPFEMPAGPYAVLHVGAGSRLRLWEPHKWRTVAQALLERGLDVVWSAGKNESGIVSAIDPVGRHPSYAGALDLAQLWRLLANARVAVTLDTGIAHLAKLTRTPVAVIFGPGSATLFGKGRFWCDNDFAEVATRQFPCRDQQRLFGREIPWVRRCNRKPPDCPRARCMEAIAPEQVVEALNVE